jgi:hypothetical protein
MKFFAIALLFGICLLNAQTVPTEQVPIPPSMAQATQEARDAAVASAFDDSLPRNIQCQVECIEVSHEEMTKLLFQRNQSLADVTKLRKELQDMVAQKKAKVVDTMMVLCKSGQKATSESILEFSYPTEQEPGSVPNTASVPDKKITPDDVRAMEWMRSPPTPASFEPRNLGGTLEVEPTLAGINNQIDVRLSWEIVDHEGEKAWMEYKDSNNNTYKIETPKFYVKRVSTSFTTVNAGYALVATVNPQDEKGVRDTSRNWLIFAKCEIQVVR